ncbi:hypothetical protein LX36DRAFT_182332 [Colletotrichum falcatum]|nr:hypothetical protein LX36DRAFT_182332 [Colletotrichum falcatum]
MQVDKYRKVDCTYRVSVVQAEPCTRHEYRHHLPTYLATWAPNLPGSRPSRNKPSATRHKLPTWVSRPAGRQLIPGPSPPTTRNEISTLVQTVHRVRPSCPRSIPSPEQSVAPLPAKKPRACVAGIQSRRQIQVGNTSNPLVSKTKIQKVTTSKKYSWPSLPSRARTPDLCGLPARHYHVGRLTDARIKRTRKRGGRERDGNPLSS